MNIQINGKDREIRNNLNINELLQELGFNPEQPGIAVAVNREVIPKTDWDKTKIHEDNEVEIIRAVQGG